MKSLYFNILHNHLTLNDYLSWHKWRSAKPAVDWGNCWENTK